MAATRGSVWRSGRASSTQAVEFEVVLEDAYPNFSICSIPYYVSGEMAAWRHLIHRTVADLEATGIRVPLDTVGRRIDVDRHGVVVTNAGAAEETIGYDKLIVGTGALPVLPGIEGLDAPASLGVDDGVHLLHSMSDAFALARTLEQGHPRSALIVGAGVVA